MPTKEKTSKQRPKNKNQPLRIFFSQYSKFQYEPRNSPNDEFKRLCREYGWEQNSKEKKDARDRFNLALIKEFNSLYGSDEKDINNWHRLCHVLRIDPLPKTIKECRAAVKPKHVNLVDFVLVAVSGENIRIFKSEEELSEYTKETGKFFPKKSAADGGILRALRRHILEPGQGGTTQRQHSQSGNSNRPLGPSREFHSSVPIPSRDHGDAPEILAQPHLTMSCSPHALKVNSPVNAPLLCFTPLTHCASSPNLVPAATQRGCTTTVPTTRSSCHVTNHMGGYHLPLSSFPPLNYLADSHDRLYSNHCLINRIGHMKDLPRPAGVRFPRGVGLSPLFQYSPSLPRAGMRVLRVIFL